MTSEADIEVSFYGKDGENDFIRVLPDVGLKVELTFDAAKTAFAVDYDTPDAVTLRIDGDVTVHQKGDCEISVGAGVGRDVFKKSTAFQGKMEWKIDKNRSVYISSKTDGAEHSGIFGLVLTF